MKYANPGTVTSNFELVWACTRGYVFITYAQISIINAHANV